MNNTQKQFVTILSNSIRNKKTAEIYDNVDWKALLELAKSHKIDGIIYAGLNKSNLLSNIDEDDIKVLKRNVFNVGARQALNIKNLSNIFNKFNEAEIPVIVLKGLVVRDFYPHPTQRSMGDADILVHKEDLNKVRGLLLELGYLQDDHETSHHIIFTHYNLPMIEVHWGIVRKDGLKGDIDLFEDHLWRNAINVNVGDSEVLSLGYEDLALHLIIHMAAHIAASGFGVRQLSDLVLLIEKKGNLINWDRFVEKTKETGFEKFTVVIFEVCKRLFKMDIPKAIIQKEYNNSKKVELLINEIFDGGVFGKNGTATDFASQVAFNFEGEDSNATLGALKRFWSFIFPPIKKMSDRYNYAKNVRILAPVAWIHHLFAGIFNKGYKTSDKLKFITTGVSESVKKNNLLDWLEI